jgi:glycosyltransferase involved in cell wall biosynthesis
MNTHGNAHRRPAVLHITAMRARKFGALEKYFLELARVTAGRGYRTVLQYESRPLSEHYIRELSKVGVEQLIRPTQKGVVQSTLAVVSLISSTRPSVVHTHFLNGYALMAAALIARRAGVRRLVATVHTELQTDRRTWHRRFAYNRHDVVLGVSEAVTRSLLQIGVRPVIVKTHYLGFFADRLATAEGKGPIRAALGVPPDATTMLCILRDDASKGLDVVIEALPALIQRSPSVHLVVVGIESSNSVWSRKAAALGVGRNVHWAGIRDEAWRLLPAADLYVQPSRTEGLPLAIMEAMAFGLPIVASRVAGIPEAVLEHHTGLLVEPGDPKALTGALQQLVSSPSDMREMGVAGRRRYEQLFAGEPSVNRMADIYFGSQKQT